MSSLNSKPGSSTTRQRQLLHRIKRRRSWSDAELHDAIGTDSTTHLSAHEASDCIQRLSGMDLPNEPGQKRSAYAESKKTPGVIRLITPDHVEQIVRLMLWYFDGNDDAAYAWFRKHWKVDTVSQLGSAAEAGVVIHRLKEMVERKENSISEMQRSYRKDMIAGRKR